MGQSLGGIPKSALCDNPVGAVAAYLLPCLALFVAGLIAWEASRRAKGCIGNCAASPLCKEYENNDERVKILNRMDWMYNVSLFLIGLGGFFLLFALLYVFAG